MEYNNPKIGEEKRNCLRRIPKELLLQIEEQMNANKSIRRNPGNTYKEIIRNSKDTYKTGDGSVSYKTGDGSVSYVSRHRTVPCLTPMGVDVR